MPPATVNLVADSCVVRRPADSLMYTTDDRTGRLTVQRLAMLLIVFIITSSCPALWHLIQQIWSAAPQGVEHWSLLALFVTAVQIAYVIYLLQIPDQSTLWVVAIANALAAFGYAVVLGICCAEAVGWSGGIGGKGSVVRLFGVSDQVLSGRAILWCATVLGMYGLATYLFGRASLRWHAGMTVK